VHREIKKNLITAKLSRLLAHVQDPNFRGPDADECLRAAELFDVG